MIEGKKEKAILDNVACEIIKFVGAQAVFFLYSLRFKSISEYHSTALKNAFDSHIQTGLKGFPD